MIKSNKNFIFFCFLQIFSVFEGALGWIEKSFTVRKYYLFGFYGKTREKLVAVIIRLIKKEKFSGHL